MTTSVAPSSKQAQASTGFEGGISISDLAFVAGATLVVLAAVAPDQVLRDTTPIGGDLTGHIVVPWANLQDPLAWLPGAWSNSMFNGFPINGLYPVLPSLLASILALVMPLAVAFKLVVVAPVVLLPWAAWQSARWAALPAPVPVMLSLATVPYLFNTSCPSCGGTIESTVIGEYAFAWGMLLSVLALGAIDRVAREGRGSVVAAALAACASLSHPLTTLWLGIGAAAIAVGHGVWMDRRRGSRFAAAAVTASALAALWWVPFINNREWLLPNGLVRDGTTASWLWPGSMWWELTITGLALAGLAWAWRQRWWFVVACGSGAVVAIAAFMRFADGGPFYSIRVLPFWNYGRWALASVGALVLIQFTVSWIRKDRSTAVPPWIAPLVWATVTLFVLGATTGWWLVSRSPTAGQNGSASVLGIEVPIEPPTRWIARDVMAGFESRADFDELSAVQQLLRDVGEEVGCGTLMWDNGDPGDPAGPVFGDAQVFWQAAMWTNGCIVAADGVLVDSSRTAAAMQMTKSLVSLDVEPLVDGALAFNFDLERGVDRMRDMGISFYLTHGGEAGTAAESAQGLALVASTGRWQLWAVRGSSPVSAPANLPAVFEPRLADSEWAELSDQYFTADTFGSLPLVQEGDEAWPRASSQVPPEQVAAESAGLSQVGVRPDAITFRVDEIGRPVMVRASAFPGWRVDGAEGPYRATPNYLVVVPTANQVTLIKGRTPGDWLAIGTAILGCVMMVLLATWERRERQAARTASVSTGASIDSSGRAGVHGESRKVGQEG